MSTNVLADVILFTTHGPVKGHECTTIYGDRYISYEKIPFAVPPLGDLRFKAPVTLPPWEDVLDCTGKAEKPLQKNLQTNKIEGAEDCLYLNAYVKSLNTAKPLPVMVFLFAGGFERGDPTRTMHSPDYFMMQNVILVTISYRLGALGFLSLNDASLNVPGNAGLKDQLFGLRWFLQNALAFNGDPHNVTMFGSSAGAASTQYLMLTPHAQGLFHKAILMSGNVLCPWALSPVENLPFRLAQANGFDGENVDAAVLAFLQQLPAHDLVRPNLLTKAENMNDCIFAFGPVVEPYESELCIIPQQPQELLAHAWGNEIPIMLGGNSFEGLMVYGRVHATPFLVNELKDHIEHLLPMSLKRKYELPEQRTLGAKVKLTHFGEKEVEMANVLNYCDYASYKLFWHAIYRTIKARLRYASAPTYFYRFDFDSPDFNHRRIQFCGPNVRGVAHVDDLSYLFYGAFSWKLALETPEFKTIQRMIDIWTTFASTSNPNCKQTEQHEYWKPVSDADKLLCFNISHDLKVIDLPELEKIQIWESLYKGEQ